MIGQCDIQHNSSAYIENYVEIFFTQQALLEKNVYEAIIVLYAIVIFYTTCNNNIELN